MNIIVSGSLAYDRIMDFPGYFSEHILPEKIHILNVCFQVNGLREKFGGTAGNIAYALALMGERPIISAAIGHDYQALAFAGNACHPAGGTGEAIAGVPKGKIGTQG